MLNVLQSFLAFAATMLVLATLVTIIIEILSRFLRRRNRVFNHLLKQLFEKELQPFIENKVKKELEEGSDKFRAAIEEKLNSFLKDIRNSPLKPQKDKNLLSWLGGWIRWFGAGHSTKLTTEEFIRRFARSEVGSDINQLTARYVDKLIDSVCLRYEELTDAMREYIKNSSTILSIVIGIIIAVVINIDALRIINFYIKNPEIAESVANNATAYAQVYSDAQERVEKALAALDNEKTDNADSKDKAKEEMEALKSRLETVPAIVSSLKAHGIPIGIDYFPHCRFRKAVTVGSSEVFPCVDAAEHLRAKSPDSREKKDSDGLGSAYFWWVVKILITGILIGLGGPFWYDAVRGIARATQILRGRPPPQQPSTGTLPGEAAPAKAAEIFKRHVEKSLTNITNQVQSD